MSERMNHLFRRYHSASIDPQKVLTLCGKVTTWKRIAPEKCVTCPRCMAERLTWDDRMRPAPTPRPAHEEG